MPARPRADDVVRVVARVQHDARDVGGVAQLGALGTELAGQVDPRLRLVLGRVLLRVGVEDRPLGLARRRKRHLVGGILAIEQPGDHAVLALIDRAGARLTAHRPVHGFDCHLAGEGRGVGLPRRDLALRVAVVVCRACPTAW